MGFYVNVLISGGYGGGDRRPAALILNELPRTGEILDIGGGRSIVVENVTTSTDSTLAIGCDAVVAGPLART